MAEEPRRPVVEEKEIAEEERHEAPAASPSAPTVQTSTSTLAIASLATGIASWFIIPLFGAVAAVITGYFGLQEVRQSGGRVGGAPLATAGIVLGGVQLGLILLFAILVIVVASSIGPTTSAAVPFALLSLLLRF